MNDAIETVWKIWTDGGWLMFPLGILGILIYGSIIEIILYLNKLLTGNEDTDLWNHWIERPDEAEGFMGEMIKYAQEDCTSLWDIRRRVQELKELHLSPVNSRMKFAMILVSTAPLTGLLGTVTGMLSTFSGLSQSAGDTIDLVAGGISEALITTQTGLVLAIPGYILINVAKRKMGSLEMFFNQLEILTVQTLARREKKATA